MGGADDTTLKVHKRTAVLDRRERTLLMLRPTEPARFATNHAHGVWHVLGSHESARFFGRLCWVMAHQTRQDTVLVIDPRFVVSNPFDADPSMPILLVNRDLCGVNRAMADDLRRLFPVRTPSEGTIKVRTGGLDAYVTGERRLADEAVATGRRWNEMQQRGLFERVNGVLVCSGATEVLRHWAVDCGHIEGTYEEQEGLAELWFDSGRAGRRSGMGEFQSFGRFDHYRQEAIEIRERLLPGTLHRELDPDERQTMWAALPERTYQ